MGQAGLGVLYACFCWMLIPAFVALIECFLMSGRVRKHNAAVAEEIVMKLKALRGWAALRGGGTPSEGQ